MFGGEYNWRDYLFLAVGVSKFSNDKLLFWKKILIPVYADKIIVK